MKKKVLIIDDDLDMCTLLCRFLERNGYETDFTYSGKQGVAKYKQEKFDIVLCDYRLGDKDGKSVLMEIKEYDSHAIVLIITGYSDISIAVDVIKKGAYDYITKPLIPDEVLNILNGIEHQADLPIQTTTSIDNSDSINEKSDRTNRIIDQQTDFIEGKSKATRELYKQIEAVAATDYSVILYGESGTGKEVLARTVHRKSKRKDKPFIAMDCGTLSKELSGSELFGHVKGAFTGAHTDKEGHFEMANGGTLFLDEVANLSYDIQASFLRVIQERKFKRVGGIKEIDLDIRIIVASNENLQDAYKRGKFREDLYHRFNEFSIDLPPLRNRQEDIPLFAEFFLKKTCTELNKQISGIDDEVMRLFMCYSWPGNLREFKNIIRRAVLLCDNDKISIKHLPIEIITGVESRSGQSSYSRGNVSENDVIEKNILPAKEKEPNLKDAAFKAEYETIMKVLKDVNFNKTKAAQILNVDRKTLYNKIKNYELSAFGSSESS